MVAYAIQMTLCMALFFGLYHLLLRRETFFISNRVYLLLAIGFSCTLPLIRIPVSEPAADNEWVLATIQIAEYVQAVDRVNVMKEETSSISWTSVWMMLYGLISCFMAVRFVRSLNYILQLRRRSSLDVQDGVTIAHSTEVLSPFSFWRTIYLPANHSFNAEELREVLRHETAHVERLHSFDILFMEFLQIAFWWNPINWLYRDALKEVHEYEADHDVVRQIPWDHYARMLTLHQTDLSPFRLSNPLIFSQLKKRIIMMNRRPSSPFAHAKFMTAIPLLIILLLVFSIQNVSTQNPADQANGESKVLNLYEDGIKILAPWEWQKVVVTAAGKPTLQTPAVDTLPEERNQKIAPSENPMIYAEVMPRFPGCEDQPEGERGKCATQKMYQYIYEGIKYPKEDREKGIQGHVICQFTIEADGSIRDVKIVRGVSPSINEEVVRIVEGMNDLPQKWTPGYHEGKAVAIRFTLPVKFQIQENKEETPAKESETKTEIADPTPPLVTINPIPAADVVGFEMALGVTDFRIFDISGKEMFAIKLKGNGIDSNFHLDVASWPPGKYFLHILHDGKKYQYTFAVVH
jgi:TonB family protein